jgi:predicted DNA-binding transcriptional regulator YafY
METLFRHWCLLRAIPRAPRKDTAAGLTDRLEREGFSVSKRTVERDLVKLSGFFPLTSDEAETGRGWFWPREAPSFDIPAIDPETALTLRILERFAVHLLPGSVVRQFEAPMRQADRVLQSLEPAAGMRAWPERVRVLPRAMQLQPPHVEPSVVDAVYEALLTGRRLSAAYHPRVAGGERRDYVINPLGLVFQDQLSYLVVSLWDYHDVRHLALHRFASAVVLDEPRSEPPDFDLDAYIAEGHFQFRESDDTLALRARFDQDAAYHLYETPISDDQVLLEAEDGTVELAASVHDTAQLHWWLLGFGASVEVVAPEALRDQIAAEVQRLAAVYGGDAKAIDG